MSYNISGQREVGQAVSIPGISDLVQVVNSLRTSISDLGQLPANVRGILIDIRNRVDDIGSEILNIVGKLDIDIQNKVNEIGTSIVTRINNVVDKASNTVDQVSTLLNGIMGSIESLQGLLPVIQNIPRIIKSLPALIISGILILLIFIGLMILIYKFIITGTDRLGIDRLLVFGTMIIVLAIVLLITYLYARSKMKL